MSTSFKKGSWSAKLTYLFFHHLPNIQKCKAGIVQVKQNPLKPKMSFLTPGSKQSSRRAEDKPNELIKATKTPSVAHSLTCTGSALPEAHRKLPINRLKLKHLLISIPYFAHLNSSPTPQLTFIVASVWIFHTPHLPHLKPSSRIP